MKKPSLTSLKKKAWKLLSILVRTEVLDSKGRATCFTCGVKKKWKKMYAGHFVQGRRPSILFNREIIRVQCVGCNRFRHGNLNRFTLKMLERYHEAQILEWFKLAETTVEITPQQYLNMIANYTEELKDRGIKV